MSLEKRIATLTSNSGTPLLTAQQIIDISSKFPYLLYQFVQRKNGTMALPFASEGVYRLFRVSPEEVKEDAAAIFAAIHPDDRALVLSSIRHSSETLTPWQQDFRVLFADGSQYRLFAHSLPEEQSDENLVWHGFVVDITSLIEKYGEFAGAERSGEMERKIRNQFLATIAHEFRSPLSLLASSTEILDRYGSRLPEARLVEQHKNIIAATRKFGELLDTMLDYCRLDKEGAPDCPQVINFSEVCQNVVAEFQKEYGQRYRFVVSISPDCGMVPLDEEQFRRMLGNLLRNAFRFTLPGGTVTLKVEREKKCLLLALTDSGIGIPPEDRQRVFEPFQCAGNAGKMKGLGLGLAIVREVLAQIGGTIMLTGEVGRGTGVRVEIPVSQLPDQAGEQSRYAILVIEDDPLLCKNMGLILQMEGFEVRTAADGMIGQAMIAEKKPDLILCDILMPGMNGFTLLEEIKKNPDFCDILFIFVTALSEHADIRRGMLAGADDYLTKPFSTDDLIASVNGRLRKLGALQKRAIPVADAAEQDILRDRVSAREKEVLILVGQGATTREIAERLFISPKTVEVHRSRLMKKLEVVNAVGLAHWANIAENMEWQ